jgi:hypothetical protein
MRVLVALQFEEGDALGEFALNFVDGSRLVLSHEKAQAQVGLEAFEAEALAAPAAPLPSEDNDDQPD